MPRGPAHYSPPPDLAANQERRSVKVRGTEDADAAIQRVQSFPWAQAIVGRPWRFGERWLFIVDVGRLP